MKDIICPYCNTQLLLPQQVQKSEYINCSNCNKDFRNPLIKKQNINFSISNSILIKIAGFIGIVLLFYFFFSNEKSNTVVKNNSWDGSVYQVENYLKESYLKDPDSYESIKWSKVIDMNHNDYGYRYKVMHKYRAKNSFGGYVIESKIFYLNNDGNVIDISNDENIYNTPKISKSKQNKSFEEQMEQYKRDNDWGDN